MDLKDMFSQVIDVINDLDIESDLRPIAFAKGIELLTGPPTQGASRASTAPPVTPSQGLDADGTSALARISSRFGIDREEVEHVYHDNDGTLGIGIAASKLPKSKASAMKDLALLVAAGRQAGGYDGEWTKTAEIRSICTDFGKMDAANFASAITEMGTYFNFRGKGAGREVKVLRPGFEAAGILVQQLGQ